MSGLEAWVRPLASLMPTSDRMDKMIAWAIAIVLAALESPIPLGFP
jgi:hypothetical protein